MPSSKLSIQVEQRILLLREQRVMLDFQLAKLYEEETRSLKQAVRRNIGRFPEDFMFELTSDEVSYLRSQFVISSFDAIRQLMAPADNPAREMGFHTIPAPKPSRKPRTKGNK